MILAQNLTVLLSILLSIPPSSSFIFPTGFGNHGRGFLQTSSSPAPTALYGKLWDKLQIEPDTMDDEPGWYVMNCVAGSEMDLLAQAKHVTKDFPPELIEKIVVPTERKLRSHGKTQKVVEMKVMYPGYCFVKMRCCAETYEPLQQLPLCRSWMAGTVNQKGYKKLPPAPICLSDEEVAKFKGLEEATEKIYQEFGEDYTGRGDSGEDLIAQYEGYDVGNMVKVLSGNFEGEDGVVKRLKDGQIMVRMFTYGNVNDQWFKPNEIRTMTDAEAMKGLGGPMSPVSQDEFDISIGKRPKREQNSRSLRNDLYNSMGGRGQRNRREDRINRGERSSKDRFGRTDQEMAEEEQNWRQYREEQRAEQQQRRGDMWGIKERSSWDAGDEAASFDNDGKWKSGREQRRERDKRKSQNVADAISGDAEWDLFASDTKGGSSSNEEDEFFNKLMSELSQTVDTPEKENSGVRGSKKVENDDDDFFASLMSELSDTTQKSDMNGFEDASSKKTSLDSRFEEDDFFANLEADLSESLSQSSLDSKASEYGNDEDDFFSNLEANLSEELNLESKIESENPIIDELHDGRGKEKSNGKKDIVATKKLENNDISNHDGKEDFSNLTVNELKEILKKRGLKVSGKKADLVERLMQS